MTYRIEIYKSYNLNKTDLDSLINNITKKDYSNITFDSYIDPAIPKENSENIDVVSFGVVFYNANKKDLEIIINRLNRNDYIKTIIPIGNKIEGEK